MRCLSCLAVVDVRNAASAQPAPTPEQKAQLAPSGALRAAIVTIPFLAKQDASGQTKGVAPDLAADLARLLGVTYEPTAFKSPNEGIAALRAGKADVTFLAPTPERVALLDFAPAFMEMEITLVVAGDSPIKTLADADQPGRRIVVYEKSRQRGDGAEGADQGDHRAGAAVRHKKAFEMIKAGEADGYVDLRDQLAANSAICRAVASCRGARPQRHGDRLYQGKSRCGGLCEGLHRAAIKSGFVAKSIEKAQVQGGGLCRAGGMLIGGSGVENGRHAADRGRRRRAHGAHADQGDCRDQRACAGGCGRRARLAVLGRDAGVLAGLGSNGIAVGTDAAPLLANADG